MTTNIIKAEAKTYITFIEWLCNDINDAHPGTCTFESGNYDEDSSMVPDELAFLGFEGPWCKVSAGETSWYGDCDTNNFERIYNDLKVIAAFLGVSESANYAVNE